VTGGANPYGSIIGGWPFVWAAYGLTAAALTLYGLSLVARLRNLK
jgi:heme exporter protein D